MLRRANWTPSIVPTSADQQVFLPAADFGRLWRGTRQRSGL
jgi:hypothetical protein